MATTTVLKSVGLFFAAGLCEIGRGYLVWLWLRDGRGWFLGALGGLVLFLYGVLPTFQPAHFGRVYAAYGGVFVVMSLLWGPKSSLAGDRLTRVGRQSNGCTEVRMEMVKNSLL